MSTGSPGTPKALPSTTFAVLRPTPGSVTRSAIRPGTCPSNRSTRAAPSPMSARALARKNPVDLMIVLELGRVGLRVVRGRRVAREELGGDEVDAHVGGLRRQQRRHEQLQRRAEVELAVGVGVALRQGTVDPPRPAGPGERRSHRP